MRPEARAKLEAWLRYYEDIGLASFYRDRAAPAEPRLNEDALPTPKRRMAPAPQPAGPPPAEIPVVPVAAAPSLFDAIERVEGDTLERIRAEIGDCTRCKLCRSRSQVVFGVGNPKAELVFIGEGPGHEEDVQGIPFVGRAGQLLTQVIQAMGLQRDDVYICNVVKCRPPENRTPDREEIATCSPFLLRQLAVIQPKVIVCLGGVAAQTLLGTNRPISQYRGQWFDYRGSRLIATYHTAYLLRNPSAKAEVWADMKKVMAVLGLQPRKR